MIDSSQKMKKMTISSEHKERNNQEKEEQHQRQQQQQQQLEKNSSAMDDNDDDNDNDEEGENIPGIQFVNYHDESQLDYVMRLVGTDLSEPYSVFTYRYFLHRFPELCIFAVPVTVSDKHEKHNENDMKNIEPIGCVVCKIDPEGGGGGVFDPNLNLDTSENEEQEETNLCGYMAMLAVDTSYRRSGIGTELVKRAVRRMRKMGCNSVTLETEVSNKAAMKLYEERLGFIREELLARYYLNFGDAYRLRLSFP